MQLLIIIKNKNNVIVSRRFCPNDVFDRFHCSTPISRHVKFRGITRWPATLSWWLPESSDVI